MSRSLTANAQAQAGSPNAAPFNVLEIDHPADDLPYDAFYWLCDEGSGEYAYSNKGGDATRIDNYNTTVSKWASGKYGTAISLEPSGAGVYHWGSIAEPDTNVPVDGETALTIACWFRANTLSGPDLIVSDDGFSTFNGRQWIYIPYKDGATYGRVSKWMNLSHTSDWQHWAFVIWVEGGQINCKVYQDGSPVRTYLDQHAADSIGRWGSYLRILDGSGVGASAQEDELLIVPGWKAGDEDVAALYARSHGVRGSLFLSDASRSLSDAVTAVSCVTDWGRLSLPGSRVGSQQEGAVYPLADYAVRVHVAGEKLREALLGPDAPVGRRVRLYQFWQGGSVVWPDDRVLLYEGTLGSIAGAEAQVFREKDVTVRLNIIDRFKTLLDREAGITASREVFPDVLEEDEGRPVPLVYGRARKVEAVCIKGPRIGRLMKGCRAGDDTLYVEGGSEFPQGTALTIRIGFEYLHGTFNGNTFSVSQRGCGPNAGGAFLELTCAGHAGNASGEKDFRRLRVSDPPGIDDQFIGMWLGAPVGTQYTAGEVTYQTVSPANPFTSYIAPGNVPHEACQWRQILHYDASSGTIEINMPYLREGERSLTVDDCFVALGTQVFIGNGTTLKVGTIPTAHKAGCDVYEILDEYVYALNAAPSSAVRAVCFHGLKGEWRVPGDYAEGITQAGGGLLGAFTQSGPGLPSYPGPAGLAASGMSAGAWAGLLGAVYSSDEPDYQEIPLRMYSLDLDDGAWNEEAGTSVTTVTFKVLPLHVPFFRPSGMKVWADVEGCRGQSGELLENPSDVMRDVLVNRLGIDSGSIDSGSFAAAAGSTNWLRFAGTLSRCMRGRRLVAEIAFQARCRIRFEAGKIFLDYLSNGPGTPVSPEITTSLAREDSLQLLWEDPGETINEFEYSWRDPDGCERVDRVSQEESIAVWGRRVAAGRPFDFWLHRSRAHARQVAMFWVNRWAWPWRRGRAAGFLPLLPFERGDTVRVTSEDWGLNAQSAEVLGIAHSPGSDREVDEIEVTFRMPVYSGCASSCEAFCETGCEADCENWCQTGCELSCETACQSACQSLCELACQTTAEVEVDLCVACEVGNRVGVAGGAGPCDLAAENWTFQCDTCQTCQASCVNSCQSGCETTCESEQMSNDCDDSCIVSGCESSCQTACEPGCECGCEVECEVPCEIQCETGCVSTCQSGCQSSCQACEACETGCEDNCQTGCETSCEPGHTTNACDTACIVGNCEIACIVGGCEISGEET